MSWIAVEVEIATSEPIYVEDFLLRVENSLFKLETKGRTPEIAVEEVKPLPVTHGYWVIFCMPSTRSGFKMDYLEEIEEELSQHFEIDNFVPEKFMVL